MESLKRKDRQDRIRHEEEDVGVAGHVEVFEAGGIAGENAENADRDAEVPERGGDGGDDGFGQRDLAEPSDTPEHDTKAGLHAEAVKERVGESGADAAICEPGTVSEEAGVVEFERRQEAEDRRKDEPDGGAYKQDE